MLRHAETAETFREVPGELTLAVNITGCPFRCEGCHSPHLRKDEGPVLDDSELDRLLALHDGVTCVAFMGGDADTESLGALCRHMREKHPHLSVCWYTGRETEDVPADMLQVLDYVKTGPYRREQGPLDSPETNQRFYGIEHLPDGGVQTEDLTHLFRRGGRPVC